MESLHIIPSWFFGYNIFLEVVFAIFTGVVAFYAFKIYRLSYQRESKLFGASFTFLSVSYIIMALINILFLTVSQGNSLALNIERIIDLKNVLVGLFVFSFLLGFVTLFYTTLKIESGRVYSILAILFIISINYSYDKSLTIYFLSSVFLLFINYHYFREYFIKKHKSALLTFLGMTFLLASNLSLILEANYFLPSMYVLSNILELIGYGLIILSLLHVLKNGKKKK